MDTAHNNYCANLFTESFQNNKKQFWSYIKRIRKDHSGVLSLIVNDETNSCAKDKARISNNQFESVFTNEDLSNISIMTSNATPQMPSISFSAHGILENLVLEKALGPDVLNIYIFKHCASKIAPILQIIFTQSLSTSTLPEDWLTANITPVYKKGSRIIPSNYGPIPLTSVCSKMMEHIVFHSIMRHVQHYGILYICQCKEDDQY